MIEIVFKCKDFVVVNKPSGMPSQSDPSGDLDAMSAASELLLSLGESGALWLVHRLDRVVGGLLVFARNKAAAAELSKIISESRLEKRYLAVCEGSAPGGEMSDFIFKDGGKAFVSDRKRAGFKEANLSYVQLYEKDGKTLVDIELRTGRFHQIRAQFSSRKMPLVGDKKYGSRDTKSRAPALFARGLSFEFKKQNYSFSLMPDWKAYPWNIFPDIKENL